MIPSLIRKAINYPRERFTVFGDGKQERAFLYVKDLEGIEDGSSVNAGRSDRLTLNKAADISFKIMGWKPSRIVHDLSRPQGVASRSADLELARKLIGWNPLDYHEGFERTIKWYISNKDRSKVAAGLSESLIERAVR